MRKTAIVLIFSLLTSVALAQKDTLQKGKTKLVNSTAMSTDLNIVQNVSRAKDYAELYTAIDCAGLTETFKSKGPITLFAPTNDAFAKMPQGLLDSLQKPERRFELSSLVTYHAVAGKITAKDIARNIREHKGTATYVTLAGSKLFASVDANRNIVITDESGRRSLIRTFDVQQRNGMLHVVTGVLIPKPRLI